MKKVITIYIFLILSFVFLFLNLSNNKYSKINIENIQINEKNLSINCPVINYAEIDMFMRDEIIKTGNTIVTNYYNSKVYVDYTPYIDNNIVNYCFDIYVYINDFLKLRFVKTYSFDLEVYKQIIITPNDINSYYLTNINNYLKPYKLNINQNDLKLLKYIIYKNNIRFIIPEIISKREIIEIELPIKSYSYSELISVDNDKKLIALTFDDGPSKFTLDLIDLLNSYDVKATFFIVGIRAQTFPGLVKYIYDNNHEIGNHSYDHSDFKKLSKDEIEFQLEQTNNIIYNIINSYPRVFRLPYGSYNVKTLDLINSPIILWDCDSLDWKDYSDKKIAKIVLDNVRNNSIILFHDLSRFRKDALIEIIQTLQNENYQFVTVSELLEFYREENIVNGKIYFKK